MQSIDNNLKSTNTAPPAESPTSKGYSMANILKSVAASSDALIDVIDTGCEYISMQNDQIQSQVDQLNEINSELDGCPDSESSALNAQSLQLNAMIGLGQTNLSSSASNTLLEQQEDVNTIQSAGRDWQKAVALAERAITRK